MFYLGSTQPSPTRLNWQQRFRELAQSSRHVLLRQYYQQGVVSPETPVSETPIMALDLETTGLDPSQHGIVSIGLVPVQGQRILNSAAQQWLVKPRFELTNSSVRVHRITDSALQTAPDLIEILPEFLAAIAGKILLVHCADIERRFLTAALQVRLGEPLQFPVIDTMALEAKVHRAKPLSLWQQFRKTPRTSIRLSASRQRYGLPPYLPHHAVTDALACAELFQAQLATRYTPNTPIADLWS